MRTHQMASLPAWRRQSLTAACILLAACGGGGGGNSAAPPPPAAITCDSTSVLENGSCRVFARRVDARARTPFVENGQPVELEVVLFKPLTGDRYPTLVFNHGSTGSGSDPALFDDTFTSKSIASHFVDRGWMVAFPQRRGRGQSDGLYDEGFTANRSGYSCDFTVSTAGADRALDDVDAITDWILNRADVDTTRLVISGTSRGGILSVAYVARRPDAYLGAINFVGGWLGEGCGDHRDVNRNLFERGASFPGRSLWLYAENDTFYSVPYSRSHFDAFTVLGGMGEFNVYTRAPGFNGHFLLNDPPLWGDAIENFLQQL